MIQQKLEDLLLRSLDSTPSPDERKQLQKELKENTSLGKAQEDFTKVRVLLGDHEKATFGLFFAERVLHHIRSMQGKVEYQLFSFFKKYQLIALSILVGLLVLNIVLADSLSLKSILGLDDTESELVQIDLYNDFIQ